MRNNEKNNNNNNNIIFFKIIKPNISVKYDLCLQIYHTYFLFLEREREKEREKERNFKYPKSLMIIFINR
jgi:hypothetical protein